MQLAHTLSSSHPWSPPPSRTACACVCKTTSCPASQTYVILGAGDSPHAAEDSLSVLPNLRNAAAAANRTSGLVLLLFANAASPAIPPAAVSSFSHRTRVVIAVARFVIAVAAARCAASSPPCIRWLKPSKAPGHSRIVALLAELPAAKFDSAVAAECWASRVPLASSRTKP
jgi:hypothetical protein